MPNRLANESSPYLLQHQDNPVDWYPWGEEALNRAKAEDKPVFLSIGYSACHWCHVMEHESFQNEKIAKLLNENFVCIKVDREERPDLDQIYMQAVQFMTQSTGGWPLSAFLTPTLQPFYGGTYWPPESKWSRKGFAEIVEGVAGLWQHRRDDALEQADHVTSYLQKPSAPQELKLDLHLLDHAQKQMERSFDFRNGGFGSAPKFPHALRMQLLLRIWQRAPKKGLLEMVTLTLDRMAAGGIYDHLGGGFARYSTDDYWLAPHFEKMLYDNALLSNAYLDGYLITGDRTYRDVVRQTLDYTLNYMTDEAGGFHSTEDADSEGEEGKFYLWTPSEIKAVLGEEAGARFCYAYGVTKRGNFEDSGRSIIHLPRPLEQSAEDREWTLTDIRKEFKQAREKLLQTRDQRVRPDKDDKILTSWNALMIDAMARAAGPLQEPRYLEAARNAANFTLKQLRREDGRLMHCWRRGKKYLDAYLDDYAYFINALVSLYEACFEEQWLVLAEELAADMIRHFSDPAGGFFYTANDHEKLIARHKDVQDSSVPSSNAMAAMALLRLASLTDRGSYQQLAERTIQGAAELIQRAPAAAAQMLSAMDLAIGPVEEFVLLADLDKEETASILHEIRDMYAPRRVVAATSQATESGPLAPLTAGKSQQDGQPVLYICENFACQLPIAGAAKILARLGAPGDEA